MKQQLKMIKFHMKKVLDFKIVYCSVKYVWNFIEHAFDVKIY